MADEQRIKIGIVGVGMVGASFAYALMQRGIAHEMVLIDSNRERAEAEAMDLNHGLPYVRPMRISVGSYADLQGAALTVVTAGAAQQPGQTRLQLLERNAAILRQVVPAIVEANPNGIILLASNPVDIMTHLALTISGLPPGRVFGSGTILDTARFRFLLGQHYQVDPRSVHASIIGEHGDSEVPVWSAATIGGVRLHDYRHPAYDPAALHDIFVQTRDAAYSIIQRKGATYYAIGLGLLTIVEAIVRNQRTVLTVSSLLHGQYGVTGMCLSLPSIVGASGVETILALDLDEEELAAFGHSAAVLKGRAAELETSAEQ